MILLLVLTILVVTITTKGTQGNLTICYVRGHDHNQSKTD